MIPKSQKLTFYIQVKKSLVCGPARTVYDEHYLHEGVTSDLSQANTHTHTLTIIE